MRTTKFWVYLLALASTTAWGGVREDVTSIAQLVEEKYFDAARAASIAKELREKTAAGEFDSFANPQELAGKLTDALQPHDGHFRVSYQPRSDASKREHATPRMSFETLWRRSNYGFRRVERLPGNIGLIELSTVADIDFADQADPARRAADSALALVRDADAIILDLRDNGGGAPSMVGYLVSAFVKPNADVYNVFHSREGTESERPQVPYPQPNLDTPLFVLTSARTGSAAEAIAFTLQSCGRATIVGERSGGAANPGEPFRARDYSVFISTGSPRNPINGRNWEGEGVRPDMEVGAAMALERASIAALEHVMQHAKLGAHAKSDAQWVKEALQARGRSIEPKALVEFAGTYGSYAIAVAGEGLTATIGRRLPVTLMPLREDVFFDAQNPSRRFMFERSNGKVTGLRIATSSGDEQWLRRGGV